MQVDYQIWQTAEEIKSYLKIDFEDLIKVQTLIDWPINERRTLAEGIIAQKLWMDDKVIRFSTEIPPLASFPEFVDKYGKVRGHKHDANKACDIVAGMMADKISGMIWKVGETAFFAKYDNHAPWNPSSIDTCHLIVNFYL